MHTVEPLIETPKPTESTETRIKKAIDWFASQSVTQANLEAHVGKPVDEWDDNDLAELTANRDAIVGGGGK